MGITIFASGMIDDIDGIPGLIDDMKGIAKDNGWEYSILDDDFDEPTSVVLQSDSKKPGVSIDGTLGLKGIVLTVGNGSEALDILFDRSGMLTDIITQVSWLQGDIPEGRFSACKTQFGTIDSHIHIIDILDALKEKHVSNLVVDDEGSYWSSRDRELLAAKRAVLEHYIRHTGEVIANTEIPRDAVGDSDAIASHIEKALLAAEDKRGSTH